MATIKQMECMPSEMTCLERVHYFPRMLMTPDDMIAEQEYFRNKLRRHNRLLHGWGVVCGCEVTPGDGEYEVKIAPGYVLGPYGDEIIIAKELIFDIRTELTCGCSTESIQGEDPIDPWCTDVKKAIVKDQTYFIAVKYKEINTRFVRAHPIGCSCDQVQCEPSRILDSFVVKAFTELPQSHLENPPDLDQAFRTKQPCPICPDEPWVVLAMLKLRDRGTIAQCDIDNCSHRRWVYSFGNFGHRCKEKPIVTGLEPAQSKRDGIDHQLTIHGCFFGEPISLPPHLRDIKIEFLLPKDNKIDDYIVVKKSKKTFESAEELLSATINIKKEAAIGPRHVKVTNPDGQSTTLLNSFRVIDTTVAPEKLSIITSISQNEIEPGKGASVTIQGCNFEKGAELGFGPDIKIVETAFISAEKLVVSLDADLSAPIGPRIISITNPKGSKATFNNLFAVVEPVVPKKPIIESVTPSVLKAGDEEILSIAGKNFIKGLKIDLGKQIKAADIVSIKENEIKVKVKVQKNAAIGSRDVTVKNPGSPPEAEGGLFKVERSG